MHVGAAVASVLVGVLALGPALPAAGTTPAEPGSSAAAASTASLPDEVPLAARRPARGLPAPAVWPFGEGFPRTSGTGRVEDGALLWSDFVYDDHGPIGAGLPIEASVGAVPFGTARYPAGERYAGNAADLFRVAIGAQPDATWWRVDWTTLVETEVPAAAFGIDLDAATGASDWGFGTGIAQAGTDLVLLVTGTGAWVRDLRTGDVTAVDDLGGGHHVDLEAGSFVVSLPAAVVPPDGVWRTRVVAGLADATGSGFRSLGLERGLLPGQPNVYNVGFRTRQHEPARFNFWNDTGQALALTLGDISAFVVEVDGPRLLAGDRDPEPRPTGVSTRWFVSDLDLGHGRVEPIESLLDDEPNFLGRVQPYSIVVPSSYDPAVPTPLTFVLHSFTINHNQYAATAPALLDALCEQRGSICVTPLARGPDGQYRGAAEVDVWEVWRDVATHYALDADRTVIGGFSMGGFGTVHLAAQRPDLFAASFLLGTAATRGRLGTERIANLRWVPTYLGHGLLDELVPVGDAIETAAAFSDAGYRYRFDLHPTADHVAWSLLDAWQEAAVFVAAEDHRVTRDPDRFTYVVDPADLDPELGIGPEGAYWVRDVVAADPDAPGRIEASSEARGSSDPEVVRTGPAPEVLVPFPSLREELRWGEVARSAPRPLVELDLAGIGGATLHVDRAGLRGRAGEVVEVDSDGPVALRLEGWPSGTVVAADPGSVTEDGTAHLARLPAGRSTLVVGPADAPSARGAAEPGPATPADPALPAPATGPLPVTGAGSATSLWSLVVLLVLAARRRPGGGVRATVRADERPHGSPTVASRR